MKYPCRDMALSATAIAGVGLALAESDASSSSDYEKLLIALESLRVSFSSVEDVLAAFGLSNLPVAHKYGILFGCLTFTLTVTTVLTLLIWGGSFRRISEQSKTQKPTIPDAVAAREERPLLLERLLEARQRMVETNYPETITTTPTTTTEFTPLTRMLMNVAPDMEQLRKEGDVADLVSEDEPKQKKHKDQIRRFIPPGYEENYATAYRQCQDQPGGAMLSGVPEARFEAYARAYAGCGTWTRLSHRRSYARMYEAVACATHATERKFSQLFVNRPHDLIGRTVRLEALERQRHLKDLFQITCGEASFDCKAFNPNEIWGFLDYGPFQSPEQMAKSPLFVPPPRSAAFAMIEGVSDRLLGVVLLSNDDPQNLTISLDLPIVRPNVEGTVEQIESCFLLIDRLFALGYRRVQLAVDVHDARGKKLPGRLGFTQEGVLLKHRVVKDANRDDAVYGLLNSDWDKGARSFLFKKLHGAKAQQADDANNAKEEEKETQRQVLKQKEEAAAAASGGN